MHIFNSFSLTILILISKFHARVRIVWLLLLLSVPCDPIELEHWTLISNLLVEKLAPVWPLDYIRQVADAGHGIILNQLHSLLRSEWILQCAVTGGSASHVIVRQMTSLSSIHLKVIASSCLHWVTFFGSKLKDFHCIFIFITKI